MAKAKFKSGQRTLPPPPGLRRHLDNPDSWNVVLQAIQTPKVTDTPVEVANPKNRDPLYLDLDANRDKALKGMQERCRRESCSSSMGSRSSSSKRHRVVPGLMMRPIPRRVDRRPRRTGHHRAPWLVTRD